MDGEIADEHGHCYVAEFPLKDKEWIIHYVKTGLFKNFRAGVEGVAYANGCSPGEVLWDLVMPPHQWFISVVAIAVHAENYHRKILL